MSSAPELPPRLPSQPPPVPSHAVGSTSRRWIIGVLVGVAVLALVAFVAIPVAILVPTVEKVRETARRTIDSSNARQVIQASLIYAAQHDGRLPGRSIARDGNADGPRELATIHLVAAALAGDGGLNDMSFWFSAEDRSSTHARNEGSANPILLGDGTLNAPFLNEKSLAWDYVTGLHISHPPTTPVAWTRGLRRDGTWDRHGVYGTDGGYIAFLGGNVQFFKNLTDTPLRTPAGESTSDILRTLPTGRRIVGAGPGSLHGSENDHP